METMAHVPIQESPLMEASFDETAAQLGLSPQSIEAFLAKVNSQIEGDGLETFDGDMLVALIDLYATDNLHPERVEAMSARLLKVLSDEAAGAAPYQDVMYVRDHMSKVLARRFEIARDSRVDPNEFSVAGVHNLRHLIDPRGAFFSGSLDADEVNGLIDLYARTRLVPSKKRPLSPEILDRQLSKLSLYLQGHRPIDILEDFNGEGVNDFSAIKTYLQKQLAWLAMNPDEWRTINKASHEDEVTEEVEVEIEVEVPVVLQTNVVTLQQKRSEMPVPAFDREVARGRIESFLDASRLPEDHKKSFRYHIGLSDEQGLVQQRNDACEKVRELIAKARRRDRGKYNIKIDNLPTEKQLQIVGRLLGNRSAAVNPVSRTALVARYRTELYRRNENSNVDKGVLKRSIDKYEDTIDQALAQTLEWAIKPKYRTIMGELEEESA